ncbi:30S ribosome-binding factor RbfA [Legionella israelensis]|uniref:Ribosome-binding factor A n=2 Tax=Legionella israelensis TaxID=454 RepID=A0AAX1EDN1_9GAMM|nr:30S ribosome-binding factor RbfA [Legionella israelensis]QBR83226.1 30S ribosome-binding factor RbfA [Legionella israelensis]QBS09397.1 30S ribosome-binding factor RbfA [Legionella israelensis]QDP71755.1 30S ribosome-binding factor RbfA [Legionella israelensis]
MMNHFKRTDRVAGLIQRKLAQIIQQEVKDPRLSGFVTVSAVKVSSDLGHAKVYFTVLNEDKELATSILNSAASFLRTVLARSIKLRTVPQLHFVYDESIEYGKRLSRLIDEANAPNDSSNEED